MQRFFAFVKRDAEHVFANVISLVVCVGMVVVPSFYAWFNIAGSWDPYGNTGNLKVAVANSDAGYTGELIPMSLNMGERMTSSLVESTSIGYTMTSEDEAIEGVQSGKYYAAIVFPEDFTTDMMSVLSSSATKPKVLFYQNEKANAIAQIVTNKASTAVQQDIDESFASSVTSVGAGVLEDLTNYLDDDQLAEFTGKLNSAVTDAQKGLQETASTTRSFASILDSASSLLGNGTGGASDSVKATAEVGDGLRETAGDVRSLSSAVDGATDSVNKALASSSASMDKVKASIDDAFSDAGDAAGASQAALESAAGTVDTQVAELDKLLDALGQTDTLTKTWYESWDNGADPGFTGQIGVSRDDVYSAYVTMDGLNSSVRSLRASLADLSAGLRKTAGDVGTASGAAADSKQQLDDLVDKAKSGITSVQGDFEGDLRQSLGDLASKIDSAASDADAIGSSISSTLDAVNGTAASASKDLDDTKTSVSSAADSLDEAATKLGDLTSALDGALATGDMGTIRAILSGGSTALADFIAEPVSIDRDAIYPIENNGSAMAPFYTTLAIWIGGVVIAALVKCKPSEDALRETGAKPRHAYLGRMVFFVLIGFAQTLLILLGDLFFLGIQCEHPVLFVLAGMMASFVFVNIIYALTASFGDVGKAIAVVLMVIQVAGSGGTFPVQMLPQGFFQAAYPWLPFVHSENAMRAAMFGVYNGDFWGELVMLAAYLVPALLLGLLLRKPVVRLNDWIEEKIESTKLM
ncbi:MAG: YhgE/Pip domain-containing protein [Coriobacteriia bacterium]|nr:MAG: YhgE/Pip domain-containing protein [Coriobacteriia bacterium]